jgi:hypothetical protein
MEQLGWRQRRSPTRFDGAACVKGGLTDILAGSSGCGFMAAIAGVRLAQPLVGRALLDDAAQVR